MSAPVHYHFPRYRLAQLLREPGGKSVADAIRDATASLDAIKNDCLRTIDKGLDKLDGLWRNIGPRPSEHELLALYGAVNSLIGVASVAGLVTVDRAAYSLCDLLDRMVDAKAFDRESIAVHIRALHLLRHPESLGDSDAVREVLTGLKRVRDKFDFEIPPSAEYAALVNSTSRAAVGGKPSRPSATPLSPIRSLLQ